MGYLETTEIAIVPGNRCNSRFSLTSALPTQDLSKPRKTLLAGVKTPGDRVAGACAGKSVLRGASAAPLRPRSWITTTTKRDERRPKPRNLSPRL
jgi:hypothetical protein